MKNFLLSILSHPLSRGMSLNDPQTTNIRREIILSKPFLKRLYQEWYSLIGSCFSRDDQVLELGSGAGFLNESLPGTISTDLISTTHVDLVADSQYMPINTSSLDGVVMTDVMHHIGDCSLFLHEVVRVVKPGGKLVMIEPWNTRWSKFFYQNFHHEPFEPDATTWKVSGAGPLSDANGAIPWIVFERDIELFRSRFPEWQLVSVKPMMPFSYILSGGVSLRSLLPGWMYPFVRLIESKLDQGSWAMFAFIVLERTLHEPI